MTARPGGDQRSRAGRDHEPAQPRDRFQGEHERPGKHADAADGEPEALALLALELCAQLFQLLRADRIDSDPSAACSDR